MTPFRQIPFDRLPESPRIPHPWASTTRHTELVPSDAMGPVPTTWYTYGQGEPLLLIHGLMTSAWSWRYALEPLGARHRLVIPDLPGSGASGKPDRSYHPDRLADWIGAFAAHVGIRGANTVGNSLGGYLCLRLALRDPGAIGRLVDLHSPGIPLLRLWALHAAMRQPLAEPILSRLIGRDPERWAHRMTHYYDESLKSREEARVWAEPLRDPAGVHAFARILRETLDPREFARFCRTLADRRDRGEPFPVPLLLLYATRDPMVPASVGVELGGLIPSAELAWLDRASHFAHVDAVDRFAPIVDRFLTVAEPARGW
ncbi:MAG: alpha/beta hydrolase [Myxococcota bacterium]